MVTRRLSRAVDAGSTPAVFVVSGGVVQREHSTAIGTERQVQLLAASASAQCLLTEN